MSELTYIIAIILVTYTYIHSTLTIIKKFSAAIETNKRIKVWKMSIKQLPVALTKTVMTK